MADRRALLGLIGSRIARSLTPAMQEAAGRAAGIDVRYHLIDSHVLGLTAADLPRVLDGVRLLGFAGVNITHPFKEAVVQLLDSMEGAAGTVGAVNTVVVRDGRLIGHNTDHSGFLAAWKHAFPHRKPGRVALIGAGGVGRAIAYALLALDVDELRIVDLDSARAAALARSLADRYPEVEIAVLPDAEAALSGADGMANATPIGMHAYPGMPIPERAVTGLSWVTDAVYTPLETPLIQVARRAGLAILTGQELAIGQAVGAFALFFGIPAPIGVMRDALEREIGVRDTEAGT
jgi:shikimate dehydrogenase